MGAGAQYVHWMMHKCIMVKVGGKRNTHKVLKSRWIFLKQGGIFKSRGIMIFAKQVEIYWNRENRGEIRNLWSMTKKKKGHREIFREKVKFWKFSIESENFSKIGGNLKQRGNASWPQGGWAPLVTASVAWVSVDSIRCGCKYNYYGCQGRLGLYGHHVRV